MIAKSLFFRCQKIYFIYFILFICLYLNISYDGEIFIYFIMNFTHLLICHGILLVFCRIFPYENIPFTIFLNFISLFLIFLPLIFTIRELIDSYYIESIINLFLILIPHVIFLIYLKGKQIWHMQILILTVLEMWN